MNRREVLEAAIKCVCQDRQDQHGKPEDTFAMIADMWEIYLSHKYQIDLSLHPSDVAWMMVLFKCARSAQNPDTEDSYVDAAGYSSLAAELNEKRPSESLYNERSEYSECKWMPYEEKTHTAS